MVTMDRVDAMMREAEQAQTRAAEELESAESFQITGVQLNEMSKMVTIYQKETGEPRILPKLAAEIALQKRYRDPKSPLFKQFIFSVRPTKTYHQGKSKCLLHPSNPRRAQYDAWGLPLCMADKIASPGDVVRHMESRHPTAYRNIKRDEEDTKRAAELATQNSLAEAMLEAIKGMSQARQDPTSTGVENTAITAGPEVVFSDGIADAPLYVSDKATKPKNRGGRPRKQS